MEIPYLLLKGEGPILHFAHANGYPPQAYEPLLKEVSKFSSVYAMEMRPLWPGSTPDNFKNWEIFADDLINFLENKNNRPLIGVGHSLGGTITLLASIKRPALFKLLIIIDPAFFPEWLSLAWNILSKINIARKNHPLVKAALRRKRLFENQNTMYKKYRTKEVFRNISDDGLLAYINALGKKLPDGKFSLRYSPEWESNIYLTSMLKDRFIWNNLTKIKTPTLFIRGGRTNTFWQSTATRVMKKMPAAAFAEISDSTHLVPLEKPVEVADIIYQFIRTNTRILT